MTPTEKIAKLETVLARVLERKDAPRPVRSIPLAAAPTGRSAPMATAARPAASTAPAQPSPPAPTSATIATAVPPASAGQRAGTVEAPRAAPTALAAQSDREEMPDLEFDDDGAQVTTETVEEWEATDAEASEFDIPAHHPGPSKAPPPRKPASIELEAVSPGELEIDREPLAAVANRPVSQPSISPTPPASAQPEAPAISVTAGAGAERPGIEAQQARVPVPTPSNGVEEIEPEAEPIATIAQPAPGAAQTVERFVPQPLPPTELARVVPMARPAPTTFRTLLQRSLMLRLKG